jgi:hypothetical protein
VVEGHARVISESEAEHGIILNDFEDGDIIVAPMINPAWPRFIRARSGALLIPRFRPHFRSVRALQHEQEHLINPGIDQVPAWRRSIVCLVVVKGCLLQLAD